MYYYNRSSCQWVDLSVSRLVHESSCQLVELSVVELSESRVVLIPTGSRGLAPWRGLQGGNVPCLGGKLYFASQICIISGPFWSEFQKYYGVVARGSPSFLKRILLFLKECAFRNHKCTILVPFLSKFIRRPIYNFGSILRAKLHHFRPFFV